MSDTVSLVCIVVWYFVGMCSFVYWWTADNDFKSSDLPLMFFAGILGPFAFLVGAIIHSHGKTKVIFRCRNSK